MKHLVALTILLFAWLDGPVLAMGPVVRIDAGGGVGSGVLIGREDDRFWVLTAKHVVEGESDIRLGSVQLSQPRVSRNVDLAILSGRHADCKSWVYAQVSAEQPKNGEGVFCKGIIKAYSDRYATVLTLPDGRGTTRWGRNGEPITYAYLEKRIDSGQSGGGVFRNNGQLIGILVFTEAKERQPQGQQCQTVRTPWGIQRRCPQPQDTPEVDWYGGCVAWEQVSTFCKSVGISIGKFHVHDTVAKTPEKPVEVETTSEQTPVQTVPTARPPPEDHKLRDLAVNVSVLAARQAITTYATGGVATALLVGLSVFSFFRKRKNAKSLRDADDSSGPDAGRRVERISTRCENCERASGELRELRVQLSQLQMQPKGDPERDALIASLRQQIETLKAKPPSTEYIGYPVDKYSEALQFAKRQAVSKYPGSLSTIEYLESLVNQYLSAEDK